MTAYEIVTPKAPTLDDPVMTCDGPSTIRKIEAHLADGRWLCDFVLDAPVLFNGHLVENHVDTEVEQPDADRRTKGGG